MFLSWILTTYKVIDHHDGTFCPSSLRSSHLNSCEMVRIRLDQPASCEKAAVPGLYSYMCCLSHFPQCVHLFVLTARADGLFDPDQKDTEHMCSMDMQNLPLTMWLMCFCTHPPTPMGGEKKRKKNQSREKKQKENWPTRQSSGAGRGQTELSRTEFRRYHTGAKNMRGV